MYVASSKRAADQSEPYEQSSCAAQDGCAYVSCALAMRRLTHAAWRLAVYARGPLLPY